MLKQVALYFFRCILPLILDKKKVRVIFCPNAVNIQMDNPVKESVLSVLVGCHKNPLKCFLMTSHVVQ